MTDTATTPDDTTATTPDGPPDRARLEMLLRQRLADRDGRTQAPDAPRTDLPAVPVGRLGFSENLNPDLLRVLAGVGLDKQFVTGKGLELIDTEGRRCLDFAGAYGALPFGHNHEAIWDALLGARATAEPAFVQPSVLGAAGELAARLAEVAPGDLDRVTFVNSGAEAVEVALKLARSATGRPGILTTVNSFHGKTLGALSATGRHQYQKDFGAPVADFSHVPFMDASALEDAFTGRPGHYAAFMVEPIQGEGGVRVASDEYLRDARRICDEHGVLLVLDEVQTGLGRTGAMFASERSGVVPDIMTVAKALGGGVLPIGATLCRPSVMTETFALRHTSTFAGNAPGCRVGLASLELLTADDRAVLTNVRARSAQLVAGLEHIARAYPTVVSDVRGEGLLLGLELSDDINITGDQGLIGSMAESENLGMLVCSYLLAVEGLRLAPTLFGARVLRIEPPLIVTEAECDRLLMGLEHAISLVAGGESAALLGHLVGREGPELLRDRLPPERALRTVRPGAAPGEGQTRFAFVVHPLDLDGFEDFDPAVAHFSLPEREQLLERFAMAASLLNPAPFVVGSGTVVSSTGRSVFGELVGIPFTAEQLLALPSEHATRVVREACDLAVERGAEIVGLGAYSSIVTTNATTIPDMGVPLTTGNSFTASAAVRAIVRTATEQAVDLSSATLVVVGAGGAIGRVVASALAPRVGRIVLVGRPGPTQSPRMLRTAERVAAVLGSDVDTLLASGRLSISDDARTASRAADVVVTASSSPVALLGADDFAAGAIVCDIAQPSNISDDVPLLRPDVTMFDGGIVAIPDQPGFALRYGLPDGLTYACMAETMLLALEMAGDATERSAATRLLSVGEDLDERTLEQLGALADRHGFSLAHARTWRSTEHQGGLA